MKIPYSANVQRCPVHVDKAKLEFPALPENEQHEIVLEVHNSSQKNYLIEIVPPHLNLSGLIVNPIVKPLPAG